MPKKISLLISLLALMLPWFGAQAQIIGDLKKHEKELRQKISDIRQIDPQNYLQKAERLQLEIQAYLDFKKGTCQGDFIRGLKDDVLDDQMYKDRLKKISEFERKKIEDVCYQELKDIHLLFVNNLYYAKKNYLEHVFQQHLKELEQLKAEDLKRIEKIH